MKFRFQSGRQCGGCHSFQGQILSLPDGRREGEREGKREREREKRERERERERERGQRRDEVERGVTGESRKMRKGGYPNETGGFYC